MHFLVSVMIIDLIAYVWVGVYIKERWPTDGCASLYTPVRRGQGGWWYIGITLSVCQFVRLSGCHPVRVSDFVRTISPEPLNHFKPNLVLWCIITRQIVRQKIKNWFPIVNVKVTVRAYIIKIWLFLLYLPNCWSGCNQTRFDNTTL